MSLLVSKKRNGTMLPDFIENFFAPDTFPGMTPNFFKGFPEGAFEKVPEANVIENDTNYQVELAAPGLKRDDFNVDVDNGVLTISAEKKQSSEEQGKNFRRQEFSLDSFSRSFYLPENLKDEKIDAKYENGVLKVTLPKKESAKKLPAKKIKVS
jgi:HSP20 family protein